MTFYCYVKALGSVLVWMPVAQEADQVAHWSQAQRFDPHLLVSTC